MSGRARKYTYIKILLPLGSAGCWGRQVLESQETKWVLAGLIGVTMGPAKGAAQATAGAGTAAGGLQKPCRE